MTRQRRDPAVKAQEALDIAKRRVAKIRAKQDTLTAELDALAEELKVADRDAAYLSQSPYLNQSATKEPA